jgi:hypothetical protein
MKQGYKKYGKHFIQGYNANWPKEVPLTIYPEDHNPSVQGNHSITLYDQRTTLPDLKSWQLKTQKQSTCTRTQQR